MIIFSGRFRRSRKELMSFLKIINDNIVAVNSGHACPNQNNYRSRGLWVNPHYRGQGLAQQLLTATIEQGLYEGYNQIWSYPRLSSWPTYQAVGFELASNWESSETSEANAYCLINKKYTIPK